MAIEIAATEQDHKNGERKPVTVSLHDLEKGQVPFSVLEDAFGPSSLGILIVKDLPPEFQSLRAKLLSYASYLAQLPQSELDAITRPETHYNVGWSHGKEALRPGHLDTLKGSFYATVLSSHLRATGAAVTSPPNAWPAEALLPGFRAAFEALCALVTDVAAPVARACDTFAAARMADYEPGALERVVRTSRTHRARLLHYFPPGRGQQGGDVNEGSGGSSSTAKGENKEVKVEKEKEEEEDDWCAVHLDDGCLTGLTSALFIDESEPLPPLTTTTDPDAVLSTLAATRTYPRSPDPRAGLYIRSRAGAVVKVDIPPDCLAFQTGESLELMTRGALKAVPHFVRGPSAPTTITSNGSGTSKEEEGTRTAACVARNTLALFMQPNSDEVVDRATGMTFGEFTRMVDERYA